MLRSVLTIMFVCIFVETLSAQSAGVTSADALSSSAKSARFERIVLSEQFHSEGTAVADLNNDGNNDIISGPYWYEGPEFTTRHAYATVENYSIKAYSDHFFLFAEDFDCDGRVDILSLPIPGGDAVWFQNPGIDDGEDDGPASKLWTRHVALKAVGNESPAFTNLVGDDRRELVCIHDGQYGYATPNVDKPTAEWNFTAVSAKKGYGRFTHGLGVGDVDGDGRMDLLEKEGWWRQTETLGQLFQFHPVKFAESGGSQMFAMDIDEDGDNDVVSVQNAHGFGLCWFERRGSGDDILFVKHDVLGNLPEQNRFGLAISQMHAVAVADIDGDGTKDLITGKRFYAHGGADPGSAELPVLYWFRTAASKSGIDFLPYLIDQRIGVGTQLVAQDVDGNGHVDIVVGNKMGTFLLLNRGVAEDPPIESALPLHIVGTNEFKNGVRTTEPLEPEAQRATFVLPPGFEAQLVASEPQIAKPLNMAFDSKGRLWVSSSTEYPYPATEGEGRDTIKILEDTNQDGHADKVITFADNLNIPIGLYPYGDGVICHSIPNIWFLHDTDGDDKADQREILYGPFDYSRDTHGMCNSFTRGYDGWLYACHGFNNHSTVAGKDGHEITMQSGNTFRMRTDGSRIEHFTHGQVNPFGMALDPDGDLFTADCHTKPVSLLMRGGYYPSFGKPDDGIGFVPDVMDHLHGSTAIGGIAIYNGGQYPEVFNGNAFGGNVMTSRVNRNSFQPTGSSVRVREESDFVISGDPWFRPVDLKIGPDGALYIADFYNRIIGHYEVPLEHPGRDRTRGRIWRIVFNDPTQRRDTIPTAKPNATSPNPLRAAIHQLRSENMTARMLATDQLVDDDGEDAIQSLEHEFDSDENQHSRIHSLWALARLGALSHDRLRTAISHTDARLRSHALDVLASSAEIPADCEQILLTGLSDDSPRVRRSAAMACAVHPAKALIAPLLSLVRESAGDPHLQHAAKMSLRDHLAREEWFRSATESADHESVRTIIDLCLALKSDFAGEYLAKHLSDLESFDREQLSPYLTFAARYAAAEHLQDIASLAEKRFSVDKPFQESLLRSVRNGLRQRGIDSSPIINAWATRLAREYLGMREGEMNVKVAQSPITWRYVPHPGAEDRKNPWTTSNKRNSADGQQQSMLHSSFPKGETLTGIYRSSSFVCPPIFHFYLAGHDGVPQREIQHKNWVRLRDAKSNAILSKWSPPRNDTAQLMTWDAKESIGRDVFVELIDGDNGTAYAWLAAGRFSIIALNPVELDDDRISATRLIADFRLPSFREPIEQLLAASKSDRESSVEYARALVALQPQSQSQSQSAALAESLSIRGLSSEQRNQIIAKLTDDTGTGTGVSLLGTATKLATAAEQLRIADRLSYDRDGITTLISLVEKGQMSPRLLQDAAIEPKLTGLTSDTQKQQIESLTEGLPDENADLLKVVNDRKAAYLADPGDKTAGAELFGKQCAVCHQVTGKGASVGPNLDGIGNRGLERVMEDVFQPGRNIDAAFRASLILTDDGNVMTGLVKRTEGAQLVLVDLKGKEQTIAIQSIEDQKTIRTSPMPANFHETLSEENTRDLFAYLLSLTQ